MTGVLWMRGSEALANHDEQVYNGAVYTNWGFGIPLLQVPFHAFASWTHLLYGFFPDRAIYFIYFAAIAPLVWAGLDRLLATRNWPTSDVDRRKAVSWASTWLVLCCALFPLLRGFTVYEQTVAYFVLAQLAALSAYLFACTSRGVAPAIALGLAAGVGLLVRPTGLIYLGAWGLLLLLQRHGRKALVFGAVAAPFVALWLYFNWARTGSPTGIGFDNSNPYCWACRWGNPFHMPVQRFGSSCNDTPAHTLDIAVTLFVGCFLFTSPPEAGSWANRCHFTFEERDPTHEPFFSPAVLVLLGWMLVHLVARRERRLAAYVPYATFAFLFANFVWAGAGFSWRYIGDFWPLIVLAAAEYVRMAPLAALRPPDFRLARVLFVCGLVVFVRFLVPWEWGRHVKARPASAAADIWDDFVDSRWPAPRPVPTKISCGARPSVPYHNGAGWGDECSIDVATNVFLGVAPKDGDSYEIRIETDGFTPDPLKVYVNGHLYDVVKDGAIYRARVDIHYAALTSPVVMATIEWARSIDRPPSGRLLSMELV